MPAIPGKPWTGVYPIAPTPFNDNGGAAVCLHPS